MVNPILPDIVTTVERLKRLPGVTKVVPGSISQSPHQHRGGEMKWVARDQNSATIRVFSQRGMQNMHVYSDNLDALQESLVVLPSKYAPSKSGSALPPESKIERERNQQPIYPAVPSPMKAAKAVTGNEVVGRMVTVSPDIAINWLERNSANRPLRQADVTRYANDMKAGRWKPGGVVIKFAKDGTIINGQHTLWAVIESATTIQVYVLTGLEADVRLVEDDHARRRLTDVMRLAHPGSTISNLHTSVASMLRYSMAWHRGESGTGSHITRQQEMSFLEEYHEPIDFAVKAFTSKGTKRGLSISPVISPLARAWFTEDKEKLQRFAVVVVTGMVEDASENSAVLLRNYLIGSNTVAYTVLMKQNTYRRAERSLRAYLDQERLTTLRPVHDELFLLPGERRKPRRT